TPARLPRRAERPDPSHVENGCDDTPLREGARTAARLASNASPSYAPAVSGGPPASSSNQSQRHGSIVSNGPANTVRTSAANGADVPAVDDPIPRSRSRAATSSGSSS